ncbi:hypothetical protein CB0940_06306 [Cercospora beticola]|uniref:Uncharacterized protein n=1 Tax=Cercospora beticola TaxID=122368 RepID=A0A2G5HXS6_CERBT|nr:hypothetical protein CB0940_06306 [Cercospora beticola]PIA97326.1 hypothetical protein CB0940_06306 [Cercospora beticola]WPA98929.1 hypothetical protein RHO25_003542 [Cercospora beticola]CAK1360226.1 unnamed protein product [Cercospora beticola]
MPSSKPPIPPGTNCIASIKGIPWPVVICSDEVAPAKFLAIRREQAHIPVIQLGRYRYIFIHNELLKPAEPHIDYLKGLKAFVDPEIQPGDGPEIIEEKQRRRAFRDLQAFEDDRFWANYIKNQSEARKIEMELRRKRHPIQQTYRVPNDSLHGRREGHLEQPSPPPKRQRVDVGSSSRQPQSPRYAARAGLSKSRHDSVMETIDISHEDENKAFVSGPFQSSAPAPTSSRRSDIDTFSRKVYQSIEKPSESIGEPTTTSSTEPGPQECRIVFPHGDPNWLIVKRSLISKCHYLAVRACDDDGATELNLEKDDRAGETNLAASDIAAVREYYSTGEIGPRLVNDPEEDPQISRLDQKPQRKFLHAEALGKAFVTAVKIGDEPLQELIYKKLGALYPLTPFGIIILARCASDLPKPMTDAHQNILSLITTQIVDYYWVIMKQHSSLLQKILESDDTLRATVFNRLRDNPQAGKLGLGGVFREE